MGENRRRKQREGGSGPQWGIKGTYRLSAATSLASLLSVGQVYIRWYPDHILIANPGGFPEGITKDTILVHEPRPGMFVLLRRFCALGLLKRPAGVLIRSTWVR